MRLNGFGLILALVGVVALGAPASALAASGPSLSGFTNDPSPLTCASSCNLSGTTSVAVSGSDAYTTAYYAGKLTAINIANPANPQIVGETAFSSNLVGGSTVNIAGGYAYVASKNLNGSMSSDDDGASGNSLTVVDISDPANPTVVGSVRDTTELFGAYGVAVAGRYAYVAAQGTLAGQPSAPDTSTGSFAIYDISGHGHPAPMGHLENSALTGSAAGALDHACSVYVSGNDAYVTAAYSDDLTIINISDPSNPQIVSVLNDAKTDIHFDVDVAVQGNDAYVVDQIGPNGRLTVVDVSNPSSPKIVGTVSAATLDGAYRIRLHGNFAYVSSSSAATVTVVDIANPANPQIVGTVTSSAHLNHTTGLDVDPTGNGTYLVASSPYLSSESNQIYPPFPGQTGGSTTSGTISTLTLDPIPITVTITAGSEPADPTTQTTAAFSFSTSDSVASDACSLDGAAFTPCSTEAAQSYSSLALGTHTFSVQATDASGVTATASYTWTVGSAPVNGSPPTVSGSTVRGATLSSGDGTWTGTPPPAFAFQWQRCNAAGANCTTITGATGASYTTLAADVGSTLEVVVDAVNGVGSASARSARTGVITPVTPTASPPRNVRSPTVSGTTTQGVRLTAINGTWTGSPVPSFSYQWQRCNSRGARCATIRGASGSRYTPTARDVGARIRVSVTGANSAGHGAAVSVAVGPVGAWVVVKQPALAGIAQRAAKLGFTLDSGRNAPAIKAVVVALAKGLGFARSTSRLTVGIAVKDSRGRRERLSIKLSHGSLTITLKAAARVARVMISGRALTVSPGLAAKVRRRKLRTLEVTVKTTNSSHQTVPLVLSLKPS
jgi:hypothetical protein